MGKHKIVPFFGLKSRQLIIHGDSTKAGLHIHMRSTLMFKQPQTVRSFVLSFLSLALHPSTPWKTCFSSDQLFRSINSVTAGSSSPSILCSVWLPPLLFSSLLCLCLCLSFSRWWNGSAARMDNGTPSLCSSSPLASVSHAHFPSTSVC